MHPSSRPNGSTFGHRLEEQTTVRLIVYETEITLNISYSVDGMKLTDKPFQQQPNKEKPHQNARRDLNLDIEGRHFQKLTLPMDPDCCR